MQTTKLLRDYSTEGFELGDRAAEGKAATVTLEIATTVTQID